METGQTEEGLPMLMVVFGAGASYDSDPSRPVFRGVPPPEISRLPLANELFANRPSFAAVMDRFPECKPIIPYLRNIKENRSVEQILAELQSQVEDFGDRLLQLTAIRFYLREMIRQCENQWNGETHGITNYKTFLDEIHHWLPNYKQVCLVTFNYDTMLETALQERLGLPFTHINDYIAPPRNYKLIKLHGSVNWVREIDGVFSSLQTQNYFLVAQEIIERISALTITDRYQVDATGQATKDQSNMNALFPAIAIPIETEKEFECPKRHVEMLMECIPQVTKLLVIGWKAMDRPFLGLLRELPQRVPVMIVSGSSRGITVVQERLSEAFAGARFAGGRFVGSEGGFTPFVVERGTTRFLRD